MTTSKPDSPQEAWKITWDSPALFNIFLGKLGLPTPGRPIKPKGAAYLRADADAPIVPFLPDHPGVYFERAPFEDTDRLRPVPKRILKACADHRAAMDACKADAGYGETEIEEVAPDDERDATATEELDPWQFVVESMQFIHADGKRMLHDKQFRYEFGHLAPKGLDVVQRIQRGKLKIKRYGRQVYIPNDAMVMEHDGETVFNIWRPSAMTPRAGNHQWFLDHCRYMFPDEQSQEYLLDFMAQLIQHPEVKINFALLLQSKQGVGKGAIGTILGRMIGKRNVVEPTSDELKKTFTGWQEGAQLAIINELMAKGTDLVERLKQPITEPLLRIEKKFGNAFSIPNHMNIIAFSNHRDALTLSDDDRRWLVLFSSAETRPESYYARLFDNIRDDAMVAAVMHYLLARKIKLNPKGKAPATAAKREMGDRTQTDITVGLQSLFDSRESPFDFDVVRIEPIMDAIREIAPNERNRNSAACLFLDHVGARKLKRSTNPGLPSYQLYSIRDHEAWSDLGPRKCTEAFLEHFANDSVDDLDFG